MRIPLLTVGLRRENDLLFARQRARQIAQLLGFSTGDSTRITTALAEIARNALVYGGGGSVAFYVDQLENRTQALGVYVEDRGPGVSNLDEILAGRYGSRTGLGVGITGSRALMDEFRIETAPGSGTRVTMYKALPRSAKALTTADIPRLADALTARGDGSPFGELQLQNQELLRALEEIMLRQAEIERLSLVADEARSRAETAQLVAEGAVAMQERFMALTTHEIRTPLSAMLGYLELLEMGYAGVLTEKQKEYFSRVWTACKHLLGVTNDFLDMAKGEAGHLNVVSHASTARHVISAATSLVAPQAALRQVEIVLTQTTDKVMYYGDEDRVRQVLANVLSNAISYSPEASQIRINAARVETVPEGSELVGGPWCAIRIEDSGPGIPPDKLARVFEPFVQVVGTQGGRNGTGLGLTVSRQLALIMGGDLTAESSGGIDGGAAFTLWLPVESPAPLGLKSTNVSDAALAR